MTPVARLIGVSVRVGDRANDCREQGLMRPSGGGRLRGERRVEIGL